MKKSLQHKVIADYDLIASSFSETRKFLWPEFKFFEKHLKPGLKILDLGCGNGRISELIQKHDCDYIGMDNSEGQINEARKLFPNVKFEIGDLVRIPLPDNSLDQIWTIAAFHHLTDKKTRAEALQEMKRVLKPGGIIIMTNWNLFQKKYRKFIWQATFNFLKTFGTRYAWNDTFIPWKHGEEELTKRYYHAFTTKELQRLFKQNGLDVVDEFHAKKGDKVGFWEGYNLCHVLEKTNVGE